MQIIAAASQTITRPADITAYASGDLVANSTTAGSVTPFAINVGYFKGIEIWRAEIRKSSATVTNATWRLHLYNDSPTCANGDNGAWSTTRSGYQGFFDVAGSAQAFTDAATAFGTYVNNSVGIPLFLTPDSDGLVYGLIEARAAYTPANAETFQVVLYGEAYS